MKCQENTEDMYSSIDLALDKIERQARKLKGKRGYRHSSNSEGTIRFALTSRESRDEEEGPRIISSQKVNSKPMSVEEAVMQMNMSNDNFFVFINSNTLDVNVIYKQQDGNIGLIEAKAPRDG
jgi:putative sigma-54 modulation protein